MVLHNFKEIITADNLQEISKKFPDNLLKARTISHINRDSFQKYVVCQNCHCMYPSDQLPKLTSAETTIKCSFVPFPRHLQRRTTSPCGFPLVKLVKTASGKRLFKPMKLFCYKSIIRSLAEMVQNQEC